MSIDPQSLPRPVQQKLASVAALSRGPRLPAEWQAFRQRMAEIQANLAIENMPLTDEERAFFDFAFGLNLPEPVEDDVLRTWNRARMTVVRPVAAE